MVITYSFCYFKTLNVTMVFPLNYKYSPHTFTLGVVEIDESERLVCSFIRAMRSRVGCNCGPKNSCIPGQCSCADDGIPCQVKLM